MGLLIMKTYSELILLDNFVDRFRYLKIDGHVGIETFGFDRYLNQALYTSSEWKRVRDMVIIRDNGCDLGIEGRDIPDRIIIHHMNPITVEDILNRNPDIFNPEYLITTRGVTHRAIHYSDESILSLGPTIRTMYDTCPWKKKG